MGCHEEIGSLGALTTSRAWCLFQGAFRNSCFPSVFISLSSAHPEIPESTLGGSMVHRSCGKSRGPSSQSPHGSVTEHIHTHTHTEVCTRVTSKGSQLLQYHLWLCFTWHSGSQGWQSYPRIAAILSPALWVSSNTLHRLLFCAALLLIVSPGCLWFYKVNEVCSCSVFTSWTPTCPFGFSVCVMLTGWVWLCRRNFLAGLIIPLKNAFQWHPGSSSLSQKEAKLQWDLCSDRAFILQCQGLREGNLLLASWIRIRV